MKYPPLKIWVIVLSIFGLLLIATAVLYKKKDTYVFRRSIELVFDQTEADSNAIRVVFMGSSLLKFAVSEGPILKELQQGRQNAFEILRFGIDAAVVADFLTNKYFISKLKAYQPHFILIQESIIQREKNKGMINLRSLVSREDLQAVWNGSYSVFKMKSLLNTSQSRVFEDSALVKPNFNFELGDVESNVQLLENFAKQVKISSIIIAEVPTPFNMEHARKDALRSTNYESLKVTLQDSLDIQFLEFNPPLPYKYFWDETHLNDAGEQIYTRWLLDQLASLVETDTASHD